MDNYEYIIASLPVLQQDDVKPGQLVAQELLDEIREQLSARDASLLDLLLDGYDPERLDAEFYRGALRHRNRFIREWFRFDLDLRNATVAFLNDSLGRPDGQDLVLLKGREADEFPEEQAVQDVLNRADLLQRERGLDDLRWRKAEELTALDVLDLECILGYTVKLKIIDRWLQLDPEAGRELFRKLVSDIRSTYDNKKQNITI